MEPLVFRFLGFFSVIFNNVMSWFMTITQSVGGFSYILGAVFAMLAVRFIIYPFLKGSVGTSDRAINNLTDKVGRGRRF